jgi:hypothetical protein
VRPSAQPRKGKGLHALLRELSDDEDNSTMMDIGLDSDAPDDPQRPWLRDYHAYINVPEQVREGWSAIQWWGVSFLVQYFNNQKLKVL